MDDYEKFSELLRYDNGQLFWRKCKPGRQISKPAGHADRHGYRRIMLDYKMYLAHRIIWLLHYKEWPKGFIDHIDGNPRNNKLENLRDVSHSENMFNNRQRRAYDLSRRTVSRDLQAYRRARGDS